MRRALHLSRPRSAVATSVGIIGFALALAAASQVAIPLAFTPVPITLQPLVVVLAGLWLGPAAGAASMALYLALGASGLPVFAPVGPPGVARLLGPTGGYLIAYPVAAMVVGLLAGRARGFLGRWLAATAGVAVLYLGGVAQLAILTGSLERAVQLGLVAFVLLDLAKAALAALLVPHSFDRAPA